MAEVTRQQVEAAIQVAKAIADAIRDLGEVPSGELYARVMGHLTLANYEKVIDSLVGAGLVKREANHLLRWVGPAEPVDPRRI